MSRFVNWNCLIPQVDTSPGIPTRRAAWASATDTGTRAPCIPARRPGPVVPARMLRAGGGWLCSQGKMADRI